MSKGKRDLTTNVDVAKSMAYGKSLRKINPRSSQAQWKSPSNRPDPVEILIKSNEDRLEKLIPLRFGKMMKSPFAFLRGAAAIFASDLSFTPATGIYTQCCGDCHLLNFGAYATPERNMVFDMNDFDETHVAPWEWDLKRLATSFVVAGDYKKLSKKINKKAIISLVKSYRENMNKYSLMRILDVWYSKIDESIILKFFSGDNEYVKQLKKFKSAAFKKSKNYVLPENVEIKNGKGKIIDQKPLIYHSKDIQSTNEKVVNFFATYRESLPVEKQFLFDKFEFSDVAYRIAGVGSVGTRCYVALFIGEDGFALLLQVKEARQSVLEQYTQKSKYKNNGERIVAGQRLMQAASDIFLGWTNTQDGKQFYVRQLRDMKIETNLDSQSPEEFINYASLCGWALAKSHSKAGDVAAISGYLGTSEAFDVSISEFAFKYAEQNENDYKRFVKAIKDGRIHAE